jgi:trafficking kinesin-binding protein 1
MTKTYHDIEAVTKLLDEKEKDLELAAQIGKQLLERDQQLESKIEILEVELDRTSDMVNQLRHEIVLKDNLLKSFIEFESEAYCEEQVHRDALAKHAHGGTVTSNEQVNEYKRRIRDLEHENRVLKSQDEVYDFVHSSSFGKKDEKSSHENCLKEIGNLIFLCAEIGIVLNDYFWLI